MKEKIEIVAMETGNCDFVSVLPLEGAAITKDVAVMSVYSKGKSRSFHLIILGIIVHAIVLLSVFDIYFQSPVIHGIEPVYPPVSVVKRLVLIVADGLRADKCFYSKTDDGQWASSYLRSLVETKGVGGLSITRVPTESRPGHVAIIAGLYEDVSAVTRGWKENPVEFDSVFNRSRYTWSWGSPDILPMFAKGASGSRVSTHSYSPEEENFADSNPSRLDTWVFEKFHEFLVEAKRNETLQTMLVQDKIIFFLHLLGLDTIGHSRKPWSKQYVDGIQVVDRGIRQVVKEVEEFYNNDSGTAYVFTADHGMTDWGSHGASDPEETNTPFVTWGAGIRSPESNYNDHFTTSHFADIINTSIQQADIAPLMSVLLGIAFPVNSVGVLPISILDGSASYKARCLLSNANQLGKQFEKHWRLKEFHSLPFVFRPFLKLSLATLYAKYDEVTRYIDEGRTDKAIQVAEELISILLEGIRYFQTYYRVPLSFCIILGFIGWITLISCLLYEAHHSASFSLDLLNDGLSKIEKQEFRPSSVPFIVITLIIITLSYSKKDPITYYLYYLLPVLTWFFINVRRCLVFSAIRALYRNFQEVFKFTFLLFFGVELLVVTFFVRETVALGLILLAVWPFCCNSKVKSKLLPLLWSFSCFGLAILFPSLPPVGRETNYNFVLLAGALSVKVTGFLLYKLDGLKMLNSWKWLSLMQVSGSVSGHLAEIPLFAVAQCLACLATVSLMLLLGFSTCNVWLISSYLTTNSSIPLVNNICSWIILGVSLPLPLFGSTFLIRRLFLVIVSLLTPFILLSFRFEALVFIWFIVLLMLWFILEANFEGVHYNELCTVKFGDNEHTSVPFNFSDVRRAYFSLFLLVASFFVLGNIANVNSFSPNSVYCFVTVFSPFVMGLLLILKILFPFLAVTTVARSIQVATRRPPSQLFWSILLLCDIMVLNFFFLVRDQGSWLEIGSSIGRFVVVMSLSIAFILLFSLSGVLTDVVVIGHLFPVKKHYS